MGRQNQKMTNMKPKSKRGGFRPGSGRKPTGRKPFLIRCKPETMTTLKSIAIQAALPTVGSVLDRDYAPQQTNLERTL